MNKCSIIAVALVALLLTGATAQAADKSWKIDKIGVDYTWGRDSWLPDTLEGDHSDNVVRRISLRAESDSLMPYLLNDSWSKWTLGGELHYSAHKANEEPASGPEDRNYDQDTGFHEIGFNLFVKRNLFDNMLYVGALGGLAYVDDFPKFENRPNWSKENQRSDIGRSHCLYTVGALAGKDWRLFKSAWALRTEGRFVHTADPFNWSYDGKYFAQYVVGLTYSY